MRRAALLTLLAATPAFGQPPSGLTRLRGELARLVQELTGGADATCSVRVRSPRGSARGEALAEVLEAAALEGIRAGGGEVRAGGATLAVSARVAGGHLDLDLQLRLPAPGWFARWLGRRPPPRRRHLRAPLDAELRSYVGGRPALTADTLVARTYPLPGRGYLAVGTANLDDDGPPELLLLRVDGLDVLRIRADPGERARPVLVASVPMPTGPPPTAAPRRPIGTLTTGNGDVLVGVSTRRQALRVAWRGALVLEGGPESCPEESHPLADACAVLRTGRDFFEAALLPRVGRRSPRPAPAPFYTRRAQWVRRVDGGADWLELVVTPEGELLARGVGRSSRRTGVGAALGVGDVDLDGEAEILTSSSAELGDGDRLEVLRLSRDARLRPLWASEPLQGSVLVAGAGDIDDDGAPELLAIEERAEGPATLWVIR